MLTSNTFALLRCFSREQELVDPAFQEPADGIEEVAERLGMKRPTVVQIEAGVRSVASIELTEFARLYKKDVSFFVGDPSPDEAPVLVLLRATADLSEDVRDEIKRCAEICRAATGLERRLSRPESAMGPFTFGFEQPQTRWEAVEHGIRLAQMERKRLGPGTMPVRKIVEIIAMHGVRVSRYELPRDISGIFFSGEETGTTILANSGHAEPRRLFSYAHEYAHLLADRAHMQGGVSRFSNREDLIEVRANAFAAHFLMPEEGVRSLLRNSGSGSPSRQVIEVYDGHREDAPDEGEVTAQRRSAQVPSEVQMLDAVRLSRHFGTSYEAVLYQLLNLKIVNKDELDSLLRDRHRAEKVNEFLGAIPSVEHEKAYDLKRTMVDLIVESLYRKEISWEEAGNYLGLVSISRDALNQLGLG